MKTEIAHHIAHLLLENDCVIVPQLGGFVAHYVSSIYNEVDQLYMPPRREIAFNPQLKLNDGLLAQSYMTAYGMNFPEATKEIAHQVKQMTKKIHQEGVIDLPNVGQLRFTMKHAFLFVPYTEVLSSPSLYGLSSFHLDTLAVLEEKQQVAALEATLTPLVESTVVNSSTVKKEVSIVQEDKEEKSTDVSLLKLVKFVNTPIRLVATTAAAILLFLVLSTPVGNSSTDGSNYAEIIPINLFEQVIPQNQSFKTADSVLDKNIKASTLKVKAQTEAHETSTNKSTSDVVSSQNCNSQSKPMVLAQSAKSYYLIIASCVSQKDADSEIVRLGKSLGRKLNCVTRNGKFRLSAGVYANRTDASKALTNLRKIPNMESSWMLIVRN